MTRPLIYTDAFAGHAAHAPDKPALIDSAGVVTYGRLWDVASRIASALHRLGIGRGDMVVAALEPSAAQAVTLAGVMSAGSVACPLNVRLAPPEVAQFLGPLRPRLAIAIERHAPLMATTGVDVLRVADDAGPEDIAAALEGMAGADREPVGVTIEETDPVFVVGTGGTTGVPKAATYSHRGLWTWSAIAAHIQEMRQDDVQLYLSPFFHSTIVTNLLTMLFIGATIEIHAGYDDDAVVDALNADRISWLYAAPTVLVRLLEARRLRVGRQGRLRVIAFGSMKSQAQMPAQLRDAFPGIRLITGYGTTEFGPVTRIKGDDIGVEPGCVGRPVPGARIEIRGPAGTRLPAGEEGEIVVWCPWQMEGYWGRPEQTAACMVEGGIRPGDIAQFDADGSIYLRGRSKEAIKTGGENVWPAEVESALMQHPKVVDAVVYGVDDAVWGERVEAAVVVASGATLTLEDVRTFGRNLIAAYKLPRSLRLIDRVPLTPLSKPDRESVRRAALRDALPDMVEREKPSGDRRSR